MGSLSIWHWVIVLVVVLMFFGKGKLPELMGDVAQGINAFKKGLRDNDPTDTDDPALKGVEMSPRELQVDKPVHVQQQEINEFAGERMI